MTVTGSRGTVTTTPASLLTIASPDGARSTSTGSVIRNRGAVAVYLGGPSVTSANGYQLDPGESVAVDLRGSDDIWAVTASSSAVCHILSAGSV